jgi:hypothetical protein
LKNGKNPTVKQCDFMKVHGLNSTKWLVCKDTSSMMVLEHRETKEIKKIVKEVVHK